MCSAPSTTPLPRASLSIGWRQPGPSNASAKRLLRLFLSMSSDNRLTLLDVAEQLADPYVPQANLRLVSRKRSHERGG